jgi:putative transposase
VKIWDIHRQSRKIYDSPRILAVSRRQGVKCSKNQVARLMSQHPIYAQRNHRRKIISQSQHDYHKAPNLLSRILKHKPRPEVGERYQLNRY